MDEYNMNYEYLCSMLVEAKYMGEEQLYLFINTKVEKQIAEKNLMLETALVPHLISESMFSIAVNEPATYLSNATLMDIQTALYQKNYNESIMSLFLDIELKSKIFDYPAELIVWKEMEPVDILAINLDVALKSYQQDLIFIDFDTYPYTQEHNIPINVHYAGVDEKYFLFYMITENRWQTKITELPISVRLPLRLNQVDIPSVLKVPKWDYIYSLYSNMEVVRNFNKDIICFIELESYFVRYELESAMALVPENISKGLFDINCTMYPRSYIDLLTNMSVEGTYTRRDLECYMCTVVNLDTDITGSIDIMGDFDYEIFSQMAIINDSIQLEDIGRIGIFVDPLWRYEPWVLKNSIGTILNRAVYQNKQKFNIVYGGSPRANFDICKFSMCYGVPHKEVPYSYMPTNVAYNVDQMKRFTNELFKFNEKELPIISKVFLFTNNPYTRNCTYLNPLIKQCDLYKIPIVMITSKGDISGTDPANPLRYQSKHKVDPNYPLEHQPHFAYGSGSKHIELYDDKTII